MKPIETLDDIAAGLAHLGRADPRLAPVIAKAGAVPLRRRAASFAGLVNIVVAQQVSVASANAIFARVEALVHPFEAATLDGLSDADLAGAGLSRPKIRTVRAIAEAVAGGLDLAHLAERPAEDAHEALCRITGVGRWTADIFLLFCAGHPDVFPSGDLALQNAVRDAFGLDDRPKPAALDALAEAWSPWRGVAARLFWAWYKVDRDGRETLPV
ncbi:DNA-3-methyladenine glycosylase family protein [Polymorphum gilvum]|uniref:DNA-3-methyladenine glycosylase II n=1 Tax=Polymorphum gilvum (strain LMG 25793 / CGMCC 1.9160 / SL003B-26A1) TaxID=991905 RepID=F2J0D6_POLGS|nr:DNA-3-methyladenine glycosylase [Polymorphum gilvum]ADZ68671.1 Putative dna-3-methyladenine glycosidase ii protein [Polymorphum gilvum SL003B-26A1]